MQAPDGLPVTLKVDGPEYSRQVPFQQILNVLIDLRCDDEDYERPETPCPPCKPSGAQITASASNGKFNVSVCDLYSVICYL